MALGRSARSSTISTTNACRAGVSNALMIPCATWSSRISRTVMMPAKRQNGERDRLQHRQHLRDDEIRCRSQRSTSTPANGASTSVGIWPQNPTTPSSSTEPVSR